MIGVICVSSDSQTTCGTIKRDDAQKIAQLKFGESGQNAIVAQAGNVGNADKTIEILIDSAKDKIIKNPRDVAELVEQAMFKTREKLRQQQCNCSSEQLREFILNYEQNFQLLIAFFLNGEPYFYIADFFTGSVNREHSHFSAIGTGATLASYIIQEFYSPDMPLQSVYASAIYAVEQVKKHDTYCSGKTKVSFLISEGNGCIYLFIPDNLLKQYVNMVTKVNPKIRKQHIKVVQKFLTKIAKEANKK